MRLILSALASLAFVSTGAFGAKLRGEIDWTENGNRRILAVEASLAVPARLGPVAATHRVSESDDPPSLSCATNLEIPGAVYTLVFSDPRSGRIVGRVQQPVKLGITQYRDIEKQSECTGPARLRPGPISIGFRGGSALRVPLPSLDRTIEATLTSSAGLVAGMLVAVPGGYRFDNAGLVDYGGTFGLFWHLYAPRQEYPIVGWQQTALRFVP